MHYSTEDIACARHNGLPDRLVRRRNSRILVLFLLLTAAAFGQSGCSDERKGGPSNNANRSAVAAATPTASAGPRLLPKEPDPYSATMIVSQGGQQPIQLEIGRWRGDRRWAVQLPGIGEAVYLEKAGLKYLMLPERKQYAELPPDALGFNGNDTLTPTAVVEKLGKAAAEKVGKEPINGVMAIKYRFGALSQGQSGGSSADNFVYVDEGSGLPVHIDADLRSISDGPGRTVVEALNVRLNPDTAMFDVPTGTKKLPSEQVKPQMDRLIATLREVAVLMGQRISGGAPVMTENAPAANTNRSARPAASPIANRKPATGSPTAIR